MAAAMQHLTSLLLVPRTTTSASEATATTTTLPPNTILISRTTLIVAIALVSTLLLTSWLTLLTLLVRAHFRRRRAQQARQWGRKSRFDARISLMRKEVDDAFSRQYTGVWQHAVPENPCLGSESPVEIMTPERIWEVAAGNHNHTDEEMQRQQRTAPKTPIMTAARERVKSLWFDPRAGLWMQKR